MRTRHVRDVRRSRAAFTVVELIVVSGIAVLLMAALFPVFARARDNARRSSCQSNQKQIMLGVMQYVRDYDERLPLGQSGDGSSWSPYFYWPHRLHPYLKSTTLWECPNDFGANGLLLNVRVENGEAGVGEGGSYCGNALVFGRVGPVIDPVRSLAEFGVPAARIAVGECRDADSNKSRRPLSLSAVNAAVVNAVRHLDGSNYAFADGHVKWLKLDAAAPMWTAP